MRSNQAAEPDEGSGGAHPEWPGALSRESLLVSATLVAFLVIFFYDIVFLGKTLRVSNTVPTALPTGHYDYPGGFPKMLPVFENTPALIEEPYFVFKSRSFAQGIFPLWNPYQGGGYPFVSAMESSLFYLPEIILYAAPSPWGWDAYLLFRLYLAGIFTYWLMRALGFARLPSLVSSAAYMFSGPILSFVAHVSVNTDVLMPLLLFLIERILTEGKRRYVFICSFVVFQIIAGGHPEHAFFAMLMGAVFLAFRMRSAPVSGSRGRALGRVIGAFAGGVGLSALVLLPFLEYVRSESWHVHPPGVGIQSEFLQNLITLVFPWYYAHGMVVLPEWMVLTWAGGWLGFFPVWFALYALLAREKSAATHAFLFVFFFYLLKIFGSPLVNWVGRMPVLDQVKFQLHATQSVALSASVLVGAAIAYLARGRDESLRLLLALVPLIGGVAWFWHFRAPANSPGDFLTVPCVLLSVAILGGVLSHRSMIRPHVFAGLLSLILLVELFVLIPRERTPRAETFQVPPYVEFLRHDPSTFRVYGIDGCLFPNTATAFGLEDIGMYEALFVKRFARYVHELLDSRFLGDDSFHAFRAELVDPGSRFLDLLNLKYFIIPSGSTIPAERQKMLGLKKVYEREVTIFERVRVLPRVLIVHRSHYVSDGEEALRLLKGGYNVEGGVILEGPPRSDLAPDLRLQDGSSVEALDLGVNHKTLRVKMESDGFVVVGDVYYPGWKARVDGKKADLLRANYLFQAVQVPAGVHEVQIAFSPMSWRLGMILSLLTLVGLLVWSTGIVKRRSHHTRIS
ncbi:MAG: YfhO family protein [Deltaproteobacteria bacterium]|nr:YfhO family protein [Deltaproteobacteria bacterium]